MKTENEKHQDDKLGVVCCYFNPCNYLSRYINFISFYQGLREYPNIKLLVIESYSDSSKYRISKVCPDVISIESSEIYWQKEQLLNIGLEKLYKEGYECITCLDADIEFSNKDWVENSISAIREYKMVQLFDKCIKKLPNSKKRIISKSTCAYFKNQLPPVEKLLQRPGEPGFAYGYHSSILETFRLYENAIMGSGDFLNLLGCIYDGNDLSVMKSDRFFAGGNEEFFNDYIEWVSRNDLEIGEINTANNTIYVEYHGEYMKRSYVGREVILKRTNYNPKEDVTLLKTGLYKINNQSLRQQILSYFQSRDEDGFIGVVNRNRPFRNKILKLILNNNPDYDITQTELDNLNELEYKEPPELHCDIPKLSNDTNRVVIASKTTEEFFAVKRISADEHIVVDKSKYPQRNTIKSTNGSGDAETYLSFIIKNYEILPECCVFISDNLKRKTREYQPLVNKVLKTNPTPDDKLIYIVDSYNTIYVDKTIHIKGTIKVTHKTKQYVNSLMPSNYNYTNWVEHFISKEKFQVLNRSVNKLTQTMILKDGVQLKYNPNNSFLISGDKIRNREKSFYETLYSRLVGEHNTEESLYINRSWDIIFK